MADPKTYYEGAQLAAAYKMYRLSMSADVVQKIINFLGKQFDPRLECLAVDVGCGSGQSTLPLAPFLRHITGVDPSADQIREVEKDSHPTNVDFRVGDAEKLPFADSSLHLVTTKSALHWFDIPKFFAEVDRVLKPGGVLAVSSGGRPLIIGHEEEHATLFLEILDKFYPKAKMERVQLLLNYYRDVEMPYECSREEIENDVEMSLSKLLGFFKSLDGFAQLEREKPDEAERMTDEIRHKFMKMIGGATDGNADEIVVRAKNTSPLILCRKPSE